MKRLTVRLMLFAAVVGSFAAGGQPARAGCDGNPTLCAPIKCVVAVGDTCLP